MNCLRFVTWVCFAAAVLPLSISFANPTYVKGRDSDAQDFFGRSVALGDGILFVGASGDGTNQYRTSIPNDLGRANGIVTIYRKDALGDWQFDRIIFGSDTDSSDQFGSRMIYDGKRLVVTAVGADTNAGAVYVFTENSSGDWEEEAKLSASNGEGTSVEPVPQVDGFGSAIAIDGDTIVVGASGESSNDATDESNNDATYAGAAYVFEFDDSVWQQTAYLKSDTIQDRAYFGSSVAVSGNQVWVGAPRTARGTDTNVGRVDAFRKDSSSWTHVAGYWGEAADDLFGTALASNQDFVAVSAVKAEVTVSSSDVRTDAGKVYLVDIVDNNWASPTVITAATPTPDTQLGNSLAFNHHHLLVGASEEDGNGAGINPADTGLNLASSGAAFIFARQSLGAWLQTHRLRASNPGASDDFGYAVDMHGNEVLVGALFEDSNTTGIDGSGSDNSTASAGAAYWFHLADIPTFSVGGTVSGLDTGQTIALSMNGGDAITAGNGDFTFPAALLTGERYTVSAVIPSGISCSLSNDSGEVAYDNIADIAITCVVGNTAPVADSQNINVNKNGSVEITLTASDADGDTLLFRPVARPAHGSISGTAPNLIYTPDTDYVGSDSFQFKVNDGTVDSATATVSITVNAVTPPNTAPTTNNQTVSTDKNASVAVTLTGSDGDGDTLTFVVVDAPSQGTLSGTAPNLTYTPNTDYVGNDSFTFKVNDGTVDSTTATVSITVNAVIPPSTGVIFSDSFE